MIDTSLKSDCNLKLLSSGSPADKADLEVADEILEINGKALQNCSHTEVISHIHNVSKEDNACHFVIHEISSSVGIIWFKFNYLFMNNLCLNPPILVHKIKDNMFEGQKKDRQQVR